MLEQAQPDHTPALDTARRSLTECDEKLSRYRAALEAGTDPAVVAQWIREVQQQRDLATAQLERVGTKIHPDRKLTREEIGQLTEILGGMSAVLRRAEPDKKIELYRKFGLKLTYDHVTRTVVAEAAPPPPVGVLIVSGGGV
ncbi:hypothetical protein [Nocardia carnea]|uniref:hypothetical protein n=1 Tax=Nocardia carnea TaxID=37328 RepID=UPI0024587F7A|nr:hypothetical protein [Nocardia carnea]